MQNSFRHNNQSPVIIAGAVNILAKNNVYHAMTTSDNAHKEKLVTYMKNLKVSNSSRHSTNLSTNANRYIYW